MIQIVLKMRKASRFFSGSKNLIRIIFPERDALITSLKFRAYAKASENIQSTVASELRSGMPVAFYFDI